MKVSVWVVEHQKSILFEKNVVINIIIVYLQSKVLKSISRATGCPKEVHKLKIIYFCSENRQITDFCVIC